MKTPTLVLLSLIIFAGCSSSSHYSSLSKQQAQVLVEEAVTQRNFVINVDRALPAQGRSITLSGGYSLRLDDNMVYSHLPYYGRAYSLPYGGGEGMIFEGAAEDYTVSMGKKGDTNISFRVRTSESLYNFNINLWPNGSANINVTPQSKQAINYTGRMKLEP